MNFLASFKLRPVRSQLFIISLGLLLLTIALYWRVGTFSFVNYDDTDYVTENPWVHEGLRWEIVRWAFTTNFANNWHPLTWISHMADYQFFGRNAGAHHLVNLAFHLSNTVLLFLVLHRATKALWKCAFVAALFALHPLHIQSVAWVAERKDVLSTFFWLLTMGAYFLYAEKMRLRWYFLALFFMACGVLSKPMVVTLPCVLLLLDFWPLRRLWSRRLLLEKIPFLALSILSSVTTYIAQRQHAVMGLDEMTLSSRLQNTVVAYMAYIYKMFWPVQLAIFYPHPTNWPVWMIAGSLVVLAGISWLMLRTFRRYPYMLTGWLWYLGTLVPVIGLMQVGSQAYADRYAYVPLIGLFIMLAWGVPDLFEKAKLSPELPPALGAFSVALCVFASGLQLSYWKNSYSLFERTLAITEDNYIVEVNLGATFADDNHPDEAIAHYRRALKMRPAEENSMADLNYALALVKKGDLEGAVPRFELALKLDPHSLKARVNLAETLTKLGQPAKALKHLHIASLLAPDLPNVHYLYGTALMNAGRNNEAEYQLRQCVQLDPSFVLAHDNLGVLLVNENRIGEALYELDAALHLEPWHFNTQYNFAATLAKTGRTREAIVHYREALRLRPDSLPALYNLASILATNPDASLRNGAEAVSLVEHAMHLTLKRDAISLNTAAAAYAEAGHFDKAVEMATQALRVAQQDGEDDLAKTIRTRLELYTQNKPFHSAG